jgi:hypothetical protein
VIRITPQRGDGRYTCPEHGGKLHRRDRRPDMTQSIAGIRDLTTDEIDLVSGGLTWAYEIRSPDGVLDVGVKLDKTTGREIPYAIWTAAQ